AKFRFDYTYSKPADGWLNLHIVPATWSDARLICHAEGAVLASPLTQPLRDAILDHVKLNSSVHTIFTGVHTTFSKGVYASIEEYHLEKRTGSCYKFHRRGLSWSQAYMTCMAEGAHLAIINSELEAVALKELYASHPDNVISAKYVNFAGIGALDSRDGGSWMTIH
ncbi:Uncharacterized protein OBRU01_09152, partial [Operophtera brumata]